LWAALWRLQACFSRHSPFTKLEELPRRLGFKKSEMITAAAARTPRKVRPVKIHYDPTADALYLRLDESRIVESEEARPGVVLDYDKDDQVVGIEMLGLRARGIPPEQLNEWTIKVAS
jgi:uncharacterized protein YuzE